jgi:hypothetical protein
VKIFFQTAHREYIVRCRSLPDPAVVDASLKHKLERNRKEGLKNLEQVKQTDYLMLSNS